MTDNTAKLDEALEQFRDAAGSGSPFHKQLAMARQYFAAATTPPDDDTEDPLDRALVQAVLSVMDGKTPHEALALVAQEHAFVLAQKPGKSIKEWHRKPEPEHVIWREPTPDEDKENPDAWVDAVVSEGEVAVLSAPGGTGKSYLTLTLARAASPPKNKDGTKPKYGAACGLRVRAGLVMLVSYEDDPIRIAARLDGMTAGEDEPVFENLCVFENPEPLFVAAGKDDPGKAQPGAGWDRLWKQARTLKPSLVIIDPASAALSDVSINEGGPVRRFMTALSTEAKRAKCGVLVVAHDTKAARNEARASGEPGAGAIAGSAQWYDAARGALYLYRCYDDSRILGCTKANYGRINWGARLSEDMLKSGRLGGFKLIEQLPTKANEAMESDAKERATRGGGKKKTTDEQKKAEDDAIHEAMMNAGRRRQQKGSDQ